MMLSPGFVVAVALCVIAICQCLALLSRRRAPDRWILETDRKIRDMQRSTRESLLEDARVVARPYVVRLQALDRRLHDFHPSSDWTTAQYVDYVARVRDEVESLTKMVQEGVKS